MNLISVHDYIMSSAIIFAVTDNSYSSTRGAATFIETNRKLQIMKAWLTETRSIMRQACVLQNWCGNSGIQEMVIFGNFRIVRTKSVFLQDKTDMLHRKFNKFLHSRHFTSHSYY